MDGCILYWVLSMSIGNFIWCKWENMDVDNRLGFLVSLYSIMGGNCWLLFLMKVKCIVYFFFVFYDL